MCLQQMNLSTLDIGLQVENVYKPYAMFYLWLKY